MPARRFRFLTCLTALIALYAGSAHGGREELVEGSALQGNLGALGKLDGSDYEARAGLDYVFPAMTDWQLRPSIGGMVTENEAYFLGIAVRRDFFINEHWVITPSFGPGVFEESDITQLGNELEFRTGLELGYRSEGGLRSGLLLQHLSNAGLGDTNPGRETLSLFVQMPLR